MNDYKFEGKYIIRFDLRTLTGLHIGGTSEGIEIGGLDNPVIKDPLTNLPYIPGSSLKGKLRSVLEWGLDRVFKDDKGETPPHTCENDPDIIKLRNEMGKEKNKAENFLKTLKNKIEQCPICRIFGLSASAEVGEPTRLTVRDAYPSDETKKNWENILGEGLYTEMKTENVIDRITSMANPRTMERVPKDSVFEVEMIYDIYKEKDDFTFIKHLFKAMQLLEDSFLGGSGSRGSGKIKFENPVFTFRSKQNYYLTQKSEEQPIALDKILQNIQPEDSVPKKLYDEFDSIPWIKKEEKKSE